MNLDPVKVGALFVGTALFVVGFGSATGHYKLAWEMWAIAVGIASVVRGCSE